MTRTQRHNSMIALAFFLAGAGDSLVDVIARGLGW
jgi:hypothetical protein